MKKLRKISGSVLAVILTILIATPGFGAPLSDQFLEKYLKTLQFSKQDSSKILAAYKTLQTDEERSEVFDRLMPTLNSATPMATQRAVTQYRRTAFERLRFLVDMEPMQYSTFRQDNAVRGQRCCPSAAPAFWVQNYGDFLTQQNRSVQGYHSDAYGISLGTEKWLDPHSVVGIGFGGAFADMKTTDWLQTGTTNSFIFSLYGAHVTRDDLKFLATIGYTYSDYELARNLYGIQVSSKHQGDVFYLSGDFSKKFHRALFDITPFITFDVVCLKEHGYDEKVAGTKTTVASIKSRDTESLIQTLGLRFERTRQNRFGWIVNPSCWFGYIHDYGDGGISTISSFFGGAPIQVDGVSMTQDRFAMGLNVSAALHQQFSLFGGYNGEFGWKFNVQTLHAGLTYEF